MNAHYSMNFITFYLYVISELQFYISFNIPLDNEVMETSKRHSFLPLNSSTIDELGSWCLRRAGGAGQQFRQREGGIHRNPASGHHPGTVTLIESVEYLPAPNTYPREGGVGKKSSAK